MRRSGYIRFAGLRRIEGGREPIVKAIKPDEANLLASLFRYVIEAQLPIAGRYLDLWWRTNLSNPDVLVEWLRGVNIENLTSWTGALGGALLHRLFLFAITLVALFLVLRDGAWLADRALTTADHLVGYPGARLISRIAEATRATVNGTIAAAIVKSAGVGTRMS